ncbi:MAG: FtsW/RodA/SpoVE family cell cycle protein [Anaerolineaceae bacterium]|nr:FtsW/RodA/SpoVE family cell cycle protein [Anaerolineaceae bacterium]
MPKRDIWKRFDFLLFAAVLLLCIFGIALISSAIAGNIALASHAKRQAIFVGIGLVVLFAVAMLDYHYWQSIGKFLYGATVFLLILTFITGKVSFGAARWLTVGLVSVQPSELAKIALILSLSYFLSRNVDKINNVWILARSFLIALGLFLWIFLQPNLSNTMVILVIWALMVWISGLKSKYILIFFAIVIAFLGVSIATDFPYLAGYQKNRVENFLRPDPEARYGETYNVDQAEISIGSGGWFGQGYGQGTQVQLRFLKIRVSDFIFSVLGNEFGFVGTTIILLLIVFVIIRCFMVAHQAQDAYGALLCYGFGVLMGFQTMVNVGVNLRVLPVTGLTLPFISYGGSSIVSMLLGIGLVESVRMRSEPNKDKLKA